MLSKTVFLEQWLEYLRGFWFKVILLLLFQ